MECMVVVCGCCQWYDLGPTGLWQPPSPQRGWNLPELGGHSSELRGFNLPNPPGNSNTGSCIQTGPQLQSTHRSEHIVQARPQNLFSARAPTRTPLGELMTLPRPSSWLEKGIPSSPFPLPARRRRLDAARTRRLSSQPPPQHKILATAVDCNKTHGYLCWFDNSRDPNAYCVLDPELGLQAPPTLFLFFLLVLCIVIRFCDLLKLFHFTIDRRQTLHTDKRKHSPQSHPWRIFHLSHN